MKNKFLHTAFGVVCGLLGAGIVFLVSRPSRGSVILLSPPPTPRFWVVQVSGAVVHPGVYELPAGSRVRDAVQAAGGLTLAASLTETNLAAPLEDGESVVIQTSIPIPTPFTSRVNLLSVTIEPVPVPTQGLPATAASAGLININTATLQELDQLPDIGPVIAQRIIDYRAENGPFANIDDIINVSGIGTVKFGKIKDLITVGP